MNDPFEVLGISRGATEDEIKAAYRKLAKKYHPDVNGGSAESEAMMKKINEAYAEALKIKRNGGYDPGPQYQYQSSGTSGSGAGYGYRDDGFDFGGFGFDFGNFGFNGRSQQRSSTPELQAVRNYINTGHYNEAMSALQRMTDRSAEWFYLAARASLGLGNRTAALSYARQAAQMDPDSYEYAQLLNRLEGNNATYRRRSTDFGGIPLNACSNPCAWICLLNMFCNCFCGGRYFFC